MSKTSSNISSVLEKHLAYLWWPITSIASDVIFPKPLNATLFEFISEFLLMHQPTLYNL